MPAVRAEHASCCGRGAAAAAAAPPGPRPLRRAAAAPARPQRSPEPAGEARPPASTARRSPTGRRSPSEGCGSRSGPAVPHGRPLSLASPRRPPTCPAPPPRGSGSAASVFLGCKSPFPSGQHHFPCGPGPGMGPGQGRLLTGAGPAPAPPQPRGLSPGAARGPPALPKLPWHDPGRLLGCAPPALTLPRARPGRRRKSIRATRGCGGKAAAAG